MKIAKPIIAFVASFVFCLAAYGQALGQITVPDRVEPHTPIVAGCNCTTPEGSEVKVRWTIVTRTPGAKSELIPVGNSVHVWASPGTHTISASVVWMEFQEVEIETPDGPRKIRNLLRWDIQGFDKTFTVGPDQPQPNPPGPNPPNPNPPNPTGFEAEIKAALASIGNPASMGKVAKVYRDVAEEANNRRDIWKPALMVNEARQRVTSSLTPSELQTWLPFWAKMNEAFKTLKLEESDTDGFIEAFRKFADCLDPQ